LEQHEAGLLNPDHQHMLNAELSLVDQLVDTELKKTLSGLVDDRVAGIKTLTEKILLALRTSDTNGATTAAEELHDAVRREQGEFRATDRLLRLLSQKREMADVQRKNRSAEVNSMTAEQASAFGAALLRAVVTVLMKHRIENPRGAMQEIETEVRRIYGADDAEEPTRNRLKAIAVMQGESEVQTPSTTEGA